MFWRLILNRVESRSLIALTIPPKKHWSSLKLGYSNLYLINKSNNELHNNTISISNTSSHEQYRQILMTTSHSVGKTLSICTLNIINPLLDTTLLSTFMNHTMRSFHCSHPLCVRNAINKKLNCRVLSYLNLWSLRNTFQQFWLTMAILIVGLTFLQSIPKNGITTQRDKI